MVKLCRDIQDIMPKISPIVKNDPVCLLVATIDQIAITIAKTNSNLKFLQVPRLLTVVDVTASFSAFVNKIFCDPWILRNGFKCSVAFFPSISVLPVLVHIPSQSGSETPSAILPTIRWYSIDKFRCWSTRGCRGVAFGPFPAFPSCIPKRAKTA
jgi:hypothetical protein